MVCRARVHTSWEALVTTTPIAVKAPSLFVIIVHVFHEGAAKHIQHTKLPAHVFPAAPLKIGTNAAMKGPMGTPMALEYPPNNVVLCPLINVASRVA